MDQATSHIVGANNIIIISYIGILGCASFMIGAIYYQADFASVVFIGGTALSIVSLLSCGEYKLDDEKVTQRNKFGTFQMFWRDVQGIDISTMGSILLNGENQRFVIIAPSYWSGPDKQEAFKFLSDKIQASGITPRRSRTGDYKGHKNCRV